MWGVDKTPLLSYNKKRVGRSMSLISQRDRKLVIKSLGFYMDEFGPLMNQTEWMEVNALINWIKLEHYKNEDKSVVLPRNEAVEVDSV